jgi:hypothetical protein
MSVTSKLKRFLELEPRRRRRAKAKSKAKCRCRMPARCKNGRFKKK